MKILKNKTWKKIEMDHKLTKANYVSLQKKFDKLRAHNDILSDQNLELNVLRKPFDVMRACMVDLMKREKSWMGYKFFKLQMSRVHKLEMTVSQVQSIISGLHKDGIIERKGLQDNRGKMKGSGFFYNPNHEPKKLVKA